MLQVHGTFVNAGYRVPNFLWEGYAVYTNNMIGGGYRGYGGPQAYFALESQHDEICEALGFEPAEFRKKNSMRQGDPHPLVPGLSLDSYALEEVIDQHPQGMPLDLAMDWFKQICAGVAYLHRLSESVQTLYAELFDQAVVAESNEAMRDSPVGSFVSIGCQALECWKVGTCRA